MRMQHTDPEDNGLLLRDSTRTLNSYFAGTPSLCSPRIVTRPRLTAQSPKAYHEGGTLHFPSYLCSIHVDELTSQACVFVSVCVCVCAGLPGIGAGPASCI